MGAPVRCAWRTRVRRGFRGSWGGSRSSWAKECGGLWGEQFAGYHIEHKLALAAVKGE